ncbi:MAG: hypothetical protein JNM63_18620, partial [Spirochaetia bacterium]|nr:hypothetical protein [Spirochaetia bacterium]
MKMISRFIDFRRVISTVLAWTFFYFGFVTVVPNRAYGSDRDRERDEDRGFDLSIKSPKDDSVLKGQFLFSVRLKEDRDDADERWKSKVEKIDFIIKKNNAIVFQKTVSSAPYQVLVNSTDFADGKYKFEVSPVAKNRKACSSDSVTATIDNTPPVFANILPVDGSFLNSNPVLVSGQIVEANLENLRVGGESLRVQGSNF